MRVHLDPTLQSAPCSWELRFLGPPGTPTQTSVKRASPPQVDVRWVATACPGPAGALEGLGAETLKRLGELV